LVDLFEYLNHKESVVTISIMQLPFCTY